MHPQWRRRALAALTAEAAGNTLAGAAAVATCATCWGGAKVRFNNAIKFFNDTGYAPDLDRISIG